MKLYRKALRQYLDDRRTRLVGKEGQRDRPGGRKQARAGAIRNGILSPKVRYWLLSTHYRKPIQATLDNISNTVRGLRRIDEFIVKVRAFEDPVGENAQLSEMICIFDQEFIDSLADDLNLPNALAAIFRFIRQANPIIDRTGVSNSQKSQILEIFQRANSILGFFDLSSRLFSPTEEKLIRDREIARKEKNWAEYDRIRNDLLKCGIRVIDTPAGTRWEYCKREDHPPAATGYIKNLSLT